MTRGPLPKPSHLRQRRNKKSSKAILEPEQNPITEKPELPTEKIDSVDDWHPLTIQFWDEIWASPMSSQFLEADKNALMMLAVLVNTFWHNPTIKNANAVKSHQMLFGLTPIDRSRLQWSFASSEGAMDKLEKQRQHKIKNVSSDSKLNVGEILGE